MLVRISDFRPDITRGHPTAPACVRWYPQIHCCRGDIEGRGSGLESQIDRHPVSPTAVLAATDPKLLKCGSTAVADTTSYC